MRLLLAEDELELSRALTAILRHSGYEVDAVHDGLTALDHLRRQAFDAAILDIMMPGMDGIEVLHQARQSGIRLPIIMLTAKVKWRIKSRASTPAPTITSPNPLRQKSCSRVFAP